MFTIKVTYRGQIRKHTFTEANTFPAYGDICHQLNRVFLIPHAFYLSKLLLSPDAAQPSRILIGKEVRSEHDYQECIRQFRDRTWPHPLLRFTVFDVSPFTFDARASSFRSSAAVPREPSHSHHLGTMSHISQLTSGSPIVSQVPMDVDALPSTRSHHSNYHIHPQLNRSTPQHGTSTSVSSSCCSVSQGKAEIRAMLTEFKDALDRVVENNLSTPEESTNSANTSTMEAPPPSLCSVCTRNIFISHYGTGSWFSCESCNIVVCVDCHGKERPGFCLALMRPHNMKFVKTSPGRESGLPIPHLPPPWTQRRSLGSNSALPNAPFFSTTTLTPDNSETTQVPAAGTTSAPAVHRGVVCDSCIATIEGIRHKCLDCPDYDLCTSCMSAGCAEAHNPFHEFLDISEPGRVIVHNVFSGNGERETSRRSGRASAPEDPVVQAEQPAVHLATCDLCDSRIVGDRYKCLACPDFDTCASCFSITNEQHPNHGFVCIHKPEDYLRIRATPRQMHYASCDGCSKTIYGARFKCMHPDCPDYDLCENCEALPIPVHPENHPMLKMTASDTVIPTVYRVGRRSLISDADSSTRDAATAMSNSIDRALGMAFAPRSSPSPPLRQLSQPWRPSPPSSVHEERVQTPTPSARAVPEASVSPVISGQDSPIKRPPVPPKPEMMSQASWASIPGFFGSSTQYDAEPFQYFERFPELPGFLGDDAKASLRNPFADVPVLENPITPAAPATPVCQERSTEHPETTNSLDISLPSVPSHTPNPWPATNPMERKELLQLIADFAGPSTSPSVLNALSDSSASNEMRTTEQRKPLVDLFGRSEYGIPTMSSPPPSVRSMNCNLPANPSPRPQVRSPSQMVPPLEPTSDNAAKVYDTPKSVQHAEKEDFTVSSEEPASMGFPFSMFHLLQGVEEPLASLKGAAETNKVPSVAGSSVSGEALLKRPSLESSTFSFSSHRSLADLINELPSLLPGQEKEPEAHIPLSAAFVEDVTISDGQVFPPGAEFMKCWRLLNDSGRDWPESTELVFVAGESMLTEKSSHSSVEVGKVAAGTEIDIWTGELKAPDAPGRYVGYWRLKADGEVFGNSLWIEINVVEADSHHSSDESMAASSIIMPTASSAARSQHVASTTVRSMSGPISITSTEDNISDGGSDISLISVPSSPSDSEDEALWHDSRSHTTAERAAAAQVGTPSSAIDYVMLYDDNSSSEE